MAYDCLATIPNKQAPALKLLSSIDAFVQFQSTSPYLKDPPSGYLFPAVDLFKGLSQISDNVKKQIYDSTKSLDPALGWLLTVDAGEYDFQLDISALLLSARDGHLVWLGNVAFGIFKFKRQFDLVSVSSDGAELPQIYVAGKALPPSWAFPIFYSFIRRSHCSSPRQQRGSC